MKFGNLLNSKLMQNMKIKKLFNYSVFPDFMIIGAQKSGTTTLHNVLSQHPDLTGSKIKELHYFDKTKDTRGSLKSYKNNFKKRIFSKKKFFESTPSYIYQNDFGKQVKEYNKNIKLIIVLRDPVYRAFSAWNMFRDMFDNFPDQVDSLKNDSGEKNPIYNLLFYGKKEFPSFEECLKLEQEIETSEPSFFRRGLYYKQIKQLLKFIEKKNVLVLFSEDLKKDFKVELEKVIDFLNVKPYDFVISNSHVRNYNSKMDSKTFIHLKNSYKTENEKLFKLINKRADWNDF